MNETLFSCDYSKSCGNVTYEGFTLTEGQQLAKFLQTEVFNHLYDKPDSDLFFSVIKQTVFSKEGERRFTECLKDRYKERRAWRVAEAFAEAILIYRHQVIIPWNTHREQRGKNDAVFGPDIVGLLPDGQGARLVIGEIKSSDEESHPPQVMLYGKRNMCQQLHEIAMSDHMIFNQIEWLYRRVPSSLRHYYDSAIARYYSFEPDSFWLIGILVRGVDANEKDLSSCASKLDEALSADVECTLSAFYLPWSIKELVPRVKKGESDV